MAAIRKRPRKGGGTSYQVVWVIGGGRWEPGKGHGTETFSTYQRAANFARDVEAAGHHWPPGWVRGRGYVTLEPEEKLSATFAKVAEDYFDHQQKRVALGRLTPYTLHRYRSMHRLYLEPIFGTVSFRAIGPDDIEEWLLDQIEDGASPKSVRNRHGLLHSIMSHGQKRLRFRPDNPCDVSDLPPDRGRRSARNLLFFRHEEWAIFRRALSNDVHLLVDVMLSTGLRWGEVTALRAGDVSFRPDGRAIIHVQRAWGKRSPQDRDHIHQEEFENRSWKLGPPKNGQTRWVGIDGAVADEVRRVAERLGHDQYLFTSPSGKPWRYPAFHGDRWKPARKLARERGLRRIVAKPHMLRHTFAVWALEEGRPIHKVSEALGHSSISITYDVYGGLLDAHDSGISDTMRRQLEIVRREVEPDPSDDAE